MGDAVTSGLFGIGGDILSGIFGASSNAQQIQANELMQQRAQDFSWKTMMEGERYDTAMSNSAMQRRVADLKAAGINPLLAVSQGGASAPMIGAPSGTGGGVGGLQNPGAAFSQLGNQVNSAMMLAANVRDTNAAAALKEAQTPNATAIPLDKDGKVDITDMLAGGHAIGNLSALGLAQGLELNKANIAKIEAATAQINQAITESQADVKYTKVQTAIADLNYQQLSSVLDWLIKGAIADAKIDIANVPGAEAEGKIMSGPKGVAIKAVQLAMGAAGQATGIGRDIKAIGAPTIIPRGGRVME